jgi:hypothetical protein
MCHQWCILESDIVEAVVDFRTEWNILSVVVVFEKYG